MRRFFLYLIVALLTFSIGSFLFMVSEYYNTPVVTEQAEKREKAECLASMPQKLSTSDIAWGMRALGCLGEPTGWCGNQPIQYEAWPEACNEYRRRLAELER